MKHKHQCIRCQCVWSHNSLGEGHEDVVKAHTCPNCGNHSYLTWQPYCGNKLPDYVEHHTEKAKIPFGSESPSFSCFDDLYWHLFQEHYIESKYLKGKTHRELAEIHDNLHR